VRIDLDDAVTQPHPIGRKFLVNGGGARPSSAVFIAVHGQRAWCRDCREFSEHHRDSGRRYRPGITAATLKVLKAAGVTLDLDEQLGGVTALEHAGDPLPDATIESIRKTRLVLKGPLTTPVGTGFRSVNVALRKEFDLFANVRPTHTILPGGRYENIDLVMIRENTEGLYVGVEAFIRDRRRSQGGWRSPWPS